jgi:PKD repeat protein
VNPGVGSAVGASVSFAVQEPTIAPNFDHSPDPADILIGESATFTDTSTTNGTSIVAWKWDFGDGKTSDIQHPTHTYDTVGTFDVSLTVTDTCGYSETEVKTDLVTVSAPTIVADFDTSPDPASILVGGSVAFNDTSTTNGPAIVAWAWDFGDGSAHVFTQDANHTYTSDGTFDVTLTVTDTLGYSDTEVKTNLVTVASSCTPLSAVDFTYTPAEPVIGETVSFDADATPLTATASLTYTWTFGDGASVTLHNQDTVTHTYIISGPQTVQVTVYNPCTPAGVSDQEAVIIAPYQIYLPLLLRNTP